MNGNLRLQLLIAGGVRDLDLGVYRS